MDIEDPTAMAAVLHAVVSAHIVMERRLLLSLSAFDHGVACLRS